RYAAAGDAGVIAPDVAGGADDRDVAQGLVLLMRSRMAATVSAGASCGTLWPTPASMRRSYPPVNWRTLPSRSEAGPTPSALPCRLMVGTAILGCAASFASIPAMAGSPGA